MSTQTETQRTLTVTNDIPIPRGDAPTTLNFYGPPEDGSVPYNYVENKPEGVAANNYTTRVHDVTIKDIRGREQDFDINVQGFGALSNLPTTQKDFDDDESIKKNYYPEIEKLLLDNVPGANRIFIFDHTIRRSGVDAKRGPVNRAHIDQTSEAVRMRVEYHMGDEAAALNAGRVRLINVWRPLNGPVVATPLAYADSRTVPDEDIVAVEHRYANRTGYTAGVKYEERGQWYYWSGMKNDEVILLQCFDSKDGARTPHSAFVDPRTQKDWPGRESIEVRTLVFG